MASKTLLSALLLLTVACSPQQGVDREAELNAILQADRAWSETPPDADDFAAFFTNDGILQGGGAPEARGHAAIRANAPGAVKWIASEGDVSACGDLGYSLGTFTATSSDSAENTAETTGKYVTIWKKQEDGSWKVAVDAFSDDGPSAVVRTWAGADPVEVDPDHYKLEFENERVRVLRISYEPGEKSVMHRHPESVAVFLTEQKVKFGAPDGTEQEDSGEPGETSWSEAEQHLPENIGDQPMELILVEVKS